MYVIPLDQTMEYEPLVPLMVPVTPLLIVATLLVIVYVQPSLLLPEQPLCVKMTLFAEFGVYVPEISTQA